MALCLNEDTQLLLPTLPLSTGPFIPKRNSAFSDTTTTPLRFRPSLSSPSFARRTDRDGHKSHNPCQEGQQDNPHQQECYRAGALPFFHDFNGVTFPTSKQSGQGSWVHFKPVSSYVFRPWHLGQDTHGAKKVRFFRVWRGYSLQDLGQVRPLGEGQGDGF
jgi:hypothetical protein